jgi:hypothetical protein
VKQEEQMDPSGKSDRVLHLAVALALTALCVHAEAALPAAGRVFIDTNGDGRLSAGDEGLGGAVVSDGTTVLKTDAEGAFAFQADTDPMLQEGERPNVALSTPDGFATTTPWFSRLSGDRAQDTTLRFGVKREAQTRPFEFLHVTDMHWVPNSSFYDTFVREVTSVPGRFRFAINTGDSFSCDHYPPETSWRLSKCAFDMLNSLNTPWRITAGNHEAIGGDYALKAGWTSTHPRYGYGLFWELYGPLRWSFTHAGVHFAGVDVMAHPSHDAWNYGSSESAIAWLQRDLATIPAGMPIYLFGHCFNDDWQPVVASANFRAVVYGDGHENRLSKWGDVPCVESGSLCPTAPAEYRGYRVFRVNADGGFDECFRFPGREAALCLFPRDFRVGPQPPTLLCMTGYGYGVPITARTVTVTVDGRPAEVRPDQPLALWTGFSARLDLALLPRGYLKAVARATHDRREVLSDEQLVLNLHGVNEAPPEAGEVTLRLGVCGLQAAAEVWVNGQKLGTIADPAGGAEPPGDPVARRFALTVPPGVAQRMNAVEVKPGLTAGKPDPVFVDYCWMEQGDAAYRDMDPRLGYGHFYGALRAHYIDLKTPMPGREQYLEHAEAHTVP